MIKTLAYLVVSMTAGAFVLSWFEPEFPTPRTAKADDASIVLQVVDVSSRRWQEIRIVPYPAEVPDSHTNIPLKASRSASDCHFVIHSDGDLQPTPAWQSQRPCPPDPQAIVVRLVGAEDDPQVPAPQWQTLMALIEKLRVRCGIPLAFVRLHLASEPTGSPNVPPQVATLRQMLASEGLGNELPVR